MTASLNLNEVKSKKLVFTVATGRCGTAFFAEILRLLPGVVSLHEPQPEYWQVLRKVQQDQQLAIDFLLEKKLPAIAKTNSRIYIETSHLFCKGFLQPLLELGIVPSLLWVRRDHRAVASSMFRAGTIPGRTEKGLAFYLSPEDPGVLPLEGWKRLNDYQLCFWYCLELERRALEYKEMYREKNWLWAETSLVHINTTKGIRQVVEELQLPSLGPINWLRYLNNRRSKVNSTSIQKQKIQLPEGLDRLEREVMELTQR